MNNGFTYQCDNPKGTPCALNPSSPPDCTKSGAATNSCCYLSNGSSKSCIWWGEGFKGIAQFNGMNVTCAAKGISASLAFFELILLFLY